MFWKKEIVGKTHDFRNTANIIFVKSMSKWTRIGFASIICNKKIEENDLIIFKHYNNIVTVKILNIDDSCNGKIDVKIKGIKIE